MGEAYKIDTYGSFESGERTGANDEVPQPVFPEDSTRKVIWNGVFDSKIGVIALGFILFVAVAVIAPQRIAVTMRSMSLSSLKKSGASQPNIVFILADDMGYGSLTQEVAPFLSSLRDNGVNIEKYYAQQSCTPSRASLMTGRYPLSIGWQSGTVSDNFNGGLDLNQTTIAEVLKDNGYTTYMLGKWNLGNRSPRNLPTARGFDKFLGFMNSFNYYWSKIDPSHTTFHDFMYSDKECYYMYDGDDLKHYSTHLYRDWAVHLIENHDFDSSPVFMYLAPNAVHDPFSDANHTFTGGIPSDYLDDVTYNYINSTYAGTISREYQKALNVLDNAVAGVYNALNDAGVMDNTYIIFASDNGGCAASGGRNYPLRGQKGTLFEGGVRVESFVHSPLLPDSVRGKTYNGLFHVSDWFPTIISMTGSEYTTDGDDDQVLDGVDQFESITQGTSNPRYKFLYNYKMSYGDDSSYWTNEPFAVRLDKYKLMHTYNSPVAGIWFKKDEVFGDDDKLNAIGTCSEIDSDMGLFEYFFFDLESDPTESVNLYNSSAKIIELQDQMYALLDDYASRAASQLSAGTESEISEVAWENSGNYVVPWVEAEDLEGVSSTSYIKSYPSNCGFYSEKR